jgi:D-alanyl-D-alanine carboxypeptidase
MAANPALLLAQVIQEENLARLKPIRNRQVKDLEIEAEAAISVFVKPDGSEKILFEKNAQKPLPIASLTKLMTANVVLEYYDVSDSKISYLLYPLLISSDNNAALNLAKFLNEEAFVDLMNLEAKKLGMENTRFFNPTGLDPKENKDQINHSTAKDLIKLAKDITTNHPLIWEITTTKAFEDNINTNELLDELPTIIGGKTGDTPRAGGCLLLILKAPKGRGYLVNVILNSKNRFEEMKKLINWTQHAYNW